MSFVLQQIIIKMFKYIIPPRKKIGSFAFFPFFYWHYTLHIFIFSSKKFQEYGKLEYLMEMMGSLMSWNIGFDVFRVFQRLFEQLYWKILLNNSPSSLFSKPTWYDGREWLQTMATALHGYNKIPPYHAIRANYKEICWPFKCYEIFLFIENLTTKTK